MHSAHSNPGARFHAKMALILNYVFLTQIMALTRQKQSSLNAPEYVPSQTINIHS